MTLVMMRDEKRIEKPLFFDTSRNVRRKQDTPLRLWGPRTVFFPDHPASRTGRCLAPAPLLTRSQGSGETYRGSRFSLKKGPKILPSINLPPEFQAEKCTQRLTSMEVENHLFLEKHGLLSGHCPLNMSRG